MLDASAVLTVVAREPGWDNVAPRLSESYISAVNLSEVAAKLAERGADLGAPRTTLADYRMSVVPFDAEQAYLAASLRPPTRRLGISFGDRACLSLGLNRGLPVVTAEHAWESLSLGVEIELIRHR